MPSKLNLNSKTNRKLENKLCLQEIILDPLVPADEEIEKWSQEGQENDDQHPYDLVISPELTVLVLMNSTSSPKQTSLMANPACGVTVNSTTFDVSP